MYGGSSPLAEYLVDKLRRLQFERSNFDSTWEHVAKLVLPTSVGFTTTYTPGTNLNQDIFDSTAQLALPRFAAAIDSLVTPQQSKWHQLAPRDKSISGDGEVTRYLSKVNDLLFRVRYAPSANFASRASESYISLGAFGNGVLYIHDARPGIRYMSIHLAEIWFEENHSGVIDTAFWVHEYTLRQAYQKWGDKLPKCYREELEKFPTKKVKFCKAVYPRVERDPRGRDNRNMPFASVDFCLEKDYAIVNESGYRTFPFAVARYTTAPREVYGRGPAHDAMANIRSLQEIVKTGLRQGQLANDPPLLAADVDSLDPFSSRPGALNFGYLTADGRELVKTLQTGSDHTMMADSRNEFRESVNGAFLINLFQVLVDTGSDRKTATEVMQLAQEKGALLGPVGARLRTEFLSVIIERELDILANAGVLNAQDVPEALRSGGDLDIEYDSPLTRAMKAEEGVGILKTIEFAGQIAQFDPSVMKKINTSRALERIAEINGAPPDILFSEEEMSEKGQAEQQAMAAQQLVEAAPEIASATKDFAQAEALTAKTQSMAGGAGQSRII